MTHLVYEILFTSFIVSTDESTNFEFLPFFMSVYTFLSLLSLFVVCEKYLRNDAKAVLMYVSQVRCN